MIYFITDGEYVKIGYTAQDDATARLLSLQPGNARKLYVLGCIDGDITTERFLHGILRNFRANGEWFLLSPEHFQDDVDTKKSIERMGETKLQVYKLLASDPEMPDSMVSAALDISRQRAWQLRKELEHDGYLQTDTSPIRLYKK